jgi:hypothetical protein
MGLFMPPKLSDIFAHNLSSDNPYHSDNYDGSMALSSSYREHLAGQWELDNFQAMVISSSTREWLDEEAKRQSWEGSGILSRPRDW